MSEQSLTPPFLEKSISQTLRQIISRFAFIPEWWTILLSILAWIWLFASLIRKTGNPKVSLCLDILVVNETTDIVELITIPGVTWFVMIVAMMYPLLLEPVRYVAFANTRRRRHGAIAIFLFAYTNFWVLVGLCMIWCNVQVQKQILNSNLIPHDLLVAGGFALTAIWMVTPLHRLSRANCGLTMPLRIYGWKSHVDSLVYGLKIGLACVRTCWAPMALLLFANHSLAAMIIVTTLLIYDRYHLKHTSVVLSYAWIIFSMYYFCSGILKLKHVFLF